MSSSNSLYELDYYTWALKQERALQERGVEELDWENRAEEVGDLARSEARNLGSQGKAFGPSAEMATATDTAD